MSRTAAELDHEPLAYIGSRPDGTARITSFRNPAVAIVVLSIIFVGMLTAIVLSVIGAIALWNLWIYVPIISLVGLYIVFNAVRLRWFRSFIRRNGHEPVLAGSPRLARLYSRRHNAD